MEADSDQRLIARLSVSKAEPGLYDYEVSLDGRPGEPLLMDTGCSRRAGDEPACRPKTEPL
jgi:hypothetical protein